MVGSGGVGDSGVVGTSVRLANRSGPPSEMGLLLMGGALLPLATIAYVEELSSLYQI